MKVPIATDQKSLFFRDRLMDWHRPEDRPLPWKENKDIYLIWLSEIMLQQTRTGQVTPYYKRFTGRFPVLESLATAEEEDVMHYWQGLGYYNRARNLHRAAKYIYFDLEGKFPSDYPSWLAIPGVGPYTAAAITSFALGLPHAVLDGNVFRLLSRYFGIFDPIDTGAGKKLFQQLADQLIDRNNPAQFNQAIMDFGATICKPQNPLCDICPLQSKCIAFIEGTIGQLPVKKRSVARKKLVLNYLHITDGEAFLLWRRPPGSIWPGLYELPSLPEDTEVNAHLKKEMGLIPTEVKKVTQLKHQLTHREITATFYRVQISDFKRLKKGDWILVKYKNFTKFAVHRLMKKYFHIFMD